MPSFTTLLSPMTRLWDGFAADQRGATAIEYAMIAAGVGGTIAATVYGFGSKLQTTFYDKLANMF
jgi:pilus assembly protein Flp/PilA